MWGRRAVSSLGALRSPSTTARLPLVSCLHKPALLLETSASSFIWPLHSRGERRGFHSTIFAAEDTKDIFLQAFEKAEETLKEEAVPTVEKKADHAGIRVRNLRISRKRLNPLLDQIRGLSYREAIVQLQFCNKRIGPKVIAAIERCRRRAEHFQLNPDRLVLAIHSSKGQFGQKRLDIKAKGRVGIMRRQHCHLWVTLKEVPIPAEGKEEKKLGKFARGVNKQRRKDWRKRVLAAARGLNLHPLYVTTRQVKRWEWEQEKKKAAEAAGAAPAGATAATA